MKFNTGQTLSYPEPQRVDEQILKDKWNISDAIKKPIINPSPTPLQSIITNKHVSNPVTEYKTVKGDKGDKGESAKITKTILYCNKRDVTVNKKSINLFTFPIDLNRWNIETITVCGKVDNMIMKLINYSSKEVLEQTVLRQNSNNIIIWDNLIITKKDKLGIEILCENISQETNTIESVEIFMIEK